MIIKNHKKTALIYGGEKIQYSELIEKIKDYTFLLKIKKGSRAAIFFENRPEWVYAFFAIWNSGGTVIPIDMMCAKDEVSYILNDSTPSVILTSDKNAPLLAQALKNVKKKPKVVNVDKIGAIKRKGDVKGMDPADDDIAAILYTSGTTGNSKGVMLSYKNIMINVYWNNSTGRININDVMLAVLPMHHSWPLMATVLCPLECGATVVFLKNLTGEELSAAMKNNKVTMLTAVPRLFELLHRGIMGKIRKNAIARALLFITRTIGSHAVGKAVFGKVHREFGGSVKVFISGGAALDPDVIKDYRGMGILMLEGYGLTETAPMVTYHPFDGQRIGSVGKVFDDIEIRFEEDGEILLKGPNVMKGYWGKPDETKAALEGGYFHTGDLGHMTKDRYLYLTGRKKDLIILPNGKNVRPDLIEAKIKEKYPLVEDIAVTEKNSRLFAVVKPSLTEAKKQGASNIFETVKWKVVDSYNREAENYKKIQDFIVINKEIPKTRMGKIKRHLLKDFISGKSKDGIKEKVPSFREYKIVSDMVQDITGEKPSPSSHLEIDLGMDSLLIMELQMRLERELGVRLKEGEIANYPTVLSLAEMARDTEPSSEAKEVEWKDVFAEGEKIDLPEKNWMMHLACKLFLAFFKKRLNLKVSGIDSIPDGPCIIAPNHQSVMDALLVTSMLPDKTLDDIYYFAKKKNFEKWYQIFFAARSHTIVMDINTDLMGSLKAVAAVLRAGKKIVLFPEGTRTRDGKIQPFKKTFAMISKELNVPVLPVVIKGAFESMPINSKIPVKGNVSVEFLKPIMPGKMTVEKIVEAALKSISEKLK